MHTRKKNIGAFTLIELLTASALVAVIMATFYTVYMSAHNIFREITEKADVNLSLAIAMNDIYRHLALSSGVSSVSADTIQFFEDPSGTPEDLTDDILSEYKTINHGGGHYSIRYRRDINGSVSTRTIADYAMMTLSQPPGAINYVQIEIQGIDQSTGQPVYLTSSALLRPHAAV
jgi:prepilin-type N-terminal cleavage/methylation domain-containing protein